MEEILSEFRNGQLHFRKVLVFSMGVILVLIGVTFMYLNEFVKKSTPDYSFVNYENQNNYFLIANLISTTTDKVFFTVSSDPEKVKYFAYLDDKTKNNLSISTKTGNQVAIYSLTPIQDDKEGFVISKIENYTK